MAELMKDQADIILENEQLAAENAQLRQAVKVLEGKCTVLAAPPAKAAETKPEAELHGRALIAAGIEKQLARQTKPAFN